MKKYLGIVKIENEFMAGASIELKTKTYDDMELMNKWFSLYPNCKHVVLENTEELDDMFDLFMDFTPVSDEEKKEMEEAKILYERLSK